MWLSLQPLPLPSPLSSLMLAPSLLTDWPTGSQLQPIGCEEYGSVLSGARQQHPGGPGRQTFTAGSLKKKGF